MMYSCEKSEFNPESGNETEVEVKTKRAPITLNIKITGKPYRQTNSRPRDGKDCGCNTCFGACDVKVEGGLSFSIMFIDPNPGNGTSRIYFAEDLPNFETEFGIDQDLSVPSAALATTGINTLVLKEGLYEFTEILGEISYNGTIYTSYGYVDVGHDIN